MEGDERIRLFCALRLPDETIDGLERWQAELRGAGRLVSRGNLHVTLAFLGRRPAGEVGAVCGALRESVAAAGGPLVLSPGRYRETRSVGMLVLEDEDARAQALARDLHRRLHGLGVYEPEARRWLPHVTVLRFRERPRLAPEPPPLGRFSPSDAAVYLSRLSPSGAQYEVLDSVLLGG